MRQGFLRLNYFGGLRLESTDLTIGETYHREKRKLHTKAFHGYGVAQGYCPPESEEQTGGLRVVARKRGDLSLEVLPGYAVDANGNDIFLYDRELVTIDKYQYRLPQDVFVTIKFVDEPTQYTVNVANPRFKGHRRIREGCKVEVEPSPPDPNESIELARIHLTSDVVEVKDASNPLAPQRGEIDMRFVPRAGLAGSGLSTKVLQKFRHQLYEMRRYFTELAGKWKIVAARDVRVAVVTGQMFAETNQVSTLQDACAILQQIVSLEEEVLQEVLERYPMMTDTKEYQALKQNVDAMSHVLKNPQYTLDEFFGLMVFQEKASKSLKDVVARDVPESTAVDLEMKRRIEVMQTHVEELRKVEPPPAAVKTPKKKKKKKDKEKPSLDTGERAADGALSLTWDELQALSGELPDKIFLEGKNYEKTDAIVMVDRKSEKAHNFKMDGYTDKWSTNQTFKYPDGKKMAAKGQAHVGGYSEWDFLNIEAGRELLIAKRIDYAYSGLVTGISVDGAEVGEWKIEGQDRKCRWRNWLFKIPAEFIKRDKATIRQTAVDADREVNMFKLWCYQHK